jgi:hypothetical protein
MPPRCTTITGLGRPFAGQKASEVERRRGREHGPYGFSLIEAKSMATVA